MKTGFIRNLEINYIDQNGETTPIEINAKLVQSEEGVRILALCRDITERKNSEMERDRMVSVVEQSSDNIIITDLQGNIEYVNPAFERSTGYSRSEILGENPRVLKSGKHEVEFYRNIWQTITNGNVWSGKITNKRKNGDLIEELATIFPVLNSNGETTNFAAVKHDMTEQNKLGKQLQQAQKLEAIGTLAGGIAHDFNNILSAVFGYAELSKIQLPNSPELQVVDGYLDKVISAGTRAKDLIDQILTFSRKGDHDPQKIDMGPLVKESIKFLRAAIPTTISINLNLDPDLKIIFGDATQIHQVIMNLCTNASHAMEKKGGTLEVGLSNRPITHKAVDTGNLSPGNYLLLTVSDTGQGIDDKIKQQIFEPFFTTKEQGKGTGLGLSVVHGIVSKHGGAIKVYSEEGIGTKFNIFLPALADNNIVIKEKIEEELPVGSESILFVDDEVELCTLYAAMLKLQGYQVQTTSSSREALNWFIEKPHHYDLIITDFTMPEINGIELAREIQKHKDNVPVILISGLKQQIPEEELKSAGIVTRFSKPIELEILVRGIRDILDRN